LIALALAIVAFLSPGPVGALLLLVNCGRVGLVLVRTCRSPRLPMRAVRLLVLLGLLLVAFIKNQPGSLGPLRRFKEILPPIKEGIFSAAHLLERPREVPCVLDMNVISGESGHAPEAARRSPRSSSA
jgi:hypothetical protein